MAELAETIYKNIHRLEVLMTQVACVTLRRVFRERWKSLTGAAWVNAPVSGSEFIAGLGSKVYKKTGLLQRRSLESGDIRNWDLTTLSQILQEVDFEKCKTEDENRNVTTERNYLQELVNIRNTLAHHPTKTIADDTFHAMWKDVAKILVFFGCSEDKLEELLLAENIGGIALKTTRPLDPKNVVEANRLKNLGNTEFDAGKLDNALRLYTEAIGISNLSDELLAKLYSNKTAVYLKKIEGNGAKKSQEAIDSALENAKKAAQMLPGWWKAHVRLGRVYEAMGKYEEAMVALNQAVALNPLNEDVKLARDTCRIILASQQRGDHLDPTHMPLSVEVQMRRMKEENGFSWSVDMWADYKKMLHKAGDSVVDVWQAHRFRDGLDEKQSYEMAAKLYEKAAKKGNAEGMYNLAVLTLHGKGVKIDIKRAIELLKQTAAEPLKKHDFQNVGVVCEDSSVTAAGRHPVEL